MKTNALHPKNVLFRSLTQTVFVTAVALTGTGGALAQSTSGMQHDNMKSMGSDGSMKLHTAMQDSQKKMNDMKMSGDMDRDFAMMMRAHHQAGIDMAKAEVESGKDPEMLKEAKKIISSQQQDIQKLDSWLKKHPAK